MAAERRKSRDSGSASDSVGDKIQKRPSREVDTGFSADQPRSAGTSKQVAPTQSSRGFLIGAAGVAILLIGGWMAYPRVKEYLDSRPDSGDYRSDKKLVEELRQATLPAVAPQASTSDWPEWRGPNRDGLSTESGLLAAWPPEGPRVVWEAPTGMGYSAPIVAGGKVYLLIQDGENEAVVCWNAADGKEIWRHRYPALFTNPESGAGPHGTPVIDGDKIYSVGATGIFFCLDAGTGKPLWSHDLLKEAKIANQEYGVSFSPLIEGDLVITMPGGPDGYSIAAYDKKDGQLVWKSLDDRAGYSSPVAATIAGKRQLVVLTAESILGVSPADGKLLWRYPWPLFKDCNIATPIVMGDYVFVASGYSKGCALLHITSAAGGLACEAKPVYEHNRFRSRFSTPVLYKDHLYGFDEFFLVCMDLRSGKVLWKKRGFNEGSLTIAEGKLYILGEQGLLALADASTEKYQERSSCMVFNKKCWTVPVLAGGKLYVRDEQSIRCLDVKGGP
jgi:outer membrane protein assembly factor BamB